MLKSGRKQAEVAAPETSLAKLPWSDLAPGMQLILNADFLGKEFRRTARQRLIDHVINNGVDYLVALGTTAETPEAAQALARQRKVLIEPVFGVLKEELGGRRFLLRGRANVDAEWTVLATAANLRTCVRLWQHDRLAA